MSIQPQMNADFTRSSAALGKALQMLRAWAGRGIFGSVNKKWNLSVYKMELLLAALHRRDWGHHVEGTRQKIGRRRSSFS